MLLAIFFFYLPLYIIKVALPCTVRYIFSFGCVLAAPSAALTHILDQQHPYESTFECYYVLFRWLFVSPVLVLFFGSAFCRVLLEAWKLGHCLSVADTPGPCSIVNVAEPFSLASSIRLAASARAEAAVSSVGPAISRRPVAKASTFLDLRPPAFFVRPAVSAISVGTSSFLGIPSAGRHIYGYADNGLVSRAVADGSRVSFSRVCWPSSAACPVELVPTPPAASTSSGILMDAGPLVTNAVSSCRRVGGGARRRLALSCSLRVRGKGRVEKPGRRVAGMSLRRRLARAAKGADIVGMSAAISLWSSVVCAAAANSCQLLLAPSSIMKVNTGLFFGHRASAPTAATANCHGSFSAAGVPRLPANGRIKKPNVVGATARRMRRAGLLEALRLQDGHLTAAAAPHAPATSASTFLWSSFAATSATLAAVAVGSAHVSVPRLPSPTRVKKPVVDSATKRRLRRAGAKEALQLHQSRLVAAGAVARSVSAARQSEIATRPIKAISRRRAARPAAGARPLGPPPIAPSAMKTFASLSSGAAVRSSASSLPDVVVAAAASLARKPSVVGVASPPRASSSLPRRLPPVNTVVQDGIPLCIVLLGRQEILPFNMVSSSSVLSWCYCNSIV